MMLRGGPRLGIYFCEKGASQRGSKVIYDRAGSSVALAKRDEFDWDKILEGADPGELLIHLQTAREKEQEGGTSP